ncbi:hypothetical protein PR048_000568 [Dryococelus australis]|uniref:Uncharacterized protein n=1 Tax=Dryococelus australis TaxID=614101 RepID=A0ABQ9IF04_9NEOP|nr:hypothetical protein PR048_000568 [Dryococelus australis]
MAQQLMVRVFSPENSRPVRGWLSPATSVATRTIFRIVLTIRPLVPFTCSVSFFLRYTCIVKRALPATVMLGALKLGQHSPARCSESLAVSGMVSRDLLIPRTLFCSPIGVLCSSPRHPFRAGSLLASHQCEPGLIPNRVTPGVSHVGIVPDDAADWRVFSGISGIPRLFIPALLHTHLNRPHRLALKTSLLRTTHPPTTNHRCSPSAKGNRVRFPAESHPGTMPPSAGFLGDLPFPPLLLILTSSAVKTQMQPRITASTNVLLTALPSSLKYEVAVAERLACSPPTKTHRVQSPAGPLTWKSCRTIFSGIFRFPPPVSFRRYSILTSITLLVSQHLAIKSRPNPSTHLLQEFS